MIAIFIYNLVAAFGEALQGQGWHWLQRKVNNK